MSRRVPTAILISGRGSNMLALAEAADDPAYPAEIVLVASDMPDAPGLAAAAARGLATATVPRREHGDRESFEAALDEALRAAAAELVCLAGFMRVLSPWFVSRWRDRMLNIHPSLLPAFRGLDTHARAIEAGVRFHGSTVHVVRPALDDGPIVLQACLAVLAEDDAASLAARVLEAEHRLYPEALRLIASGAARVVAGRVEISKRAGPREIRTMPLREQSP